MEWRPRRFNRRADALCNRILVHKENEVRYNDYKGESLIWHRKNHTIRSDCGSRNSVSAGGWAIHGDLGCLRGTEMDKKMIKEMKEYEEQYGEDEHAMMGTDGRINGEKMIAYGNFKIHRHWLIIFVIYISLILLLYNFLTVSCIIHRLLTSVHKSNILLSSRTGMNVALHCIMKRNKLYGG